MSFKITIYGASLLRIQLLALVEVAQGARLDLAEQLVAVAAVAMVVQDVDLLATASVLQHDKVKHENTITSHAVFLYLS